MMEFEHSEGNGFCKRLLQLAIGLAAGIAAATLSALALSVVMTLDPVPDSALEIAGAITAAVGAFFCGFTSLKLIGSKGLLYGAISGLILFTVKAALSLIILGSCSLTGFLTAFFVDAALGALGGITAVNTGK